MTDELVFGIALDTSGWAEIEITCGKQHVHATCSWVVDSLGDIIRGLARLASESGRFEVECDSENRGIVVLGFRRRKARFELTAKKTLSNLDGENAKQHGTRFRYRSE